MLKLKFVSSYFLLAFVIGLSHSGSAEDPTEKLNSIISKYTDATKRLDPYWATYFNVEEDLEKFGDYLSDDFLKRGKSLIESTQKELKAVDATQLPAKDLRTYLLFSGDLDVSLRGYEFPSELLAFNQMDNRIRSYLDDSSKDLTYFPFDSIKHYDAFIKRSEGFPSFIDRQIATLERGIKKGVVLSCVTAEKSLNTYKDGLEPNIEKHPFFRPISFMPAKFAKKDRTRLEKEFRSMIAERILPPLQKFDAYFRKEYLPKCRKEYGIGKLPNGNDWYTYQIEASTNLVLDPRKIHETGLKEVERIGTEIDKIQKELGFKGSRPEFLASLQKDPAMFFKSPKEMFKAFKAIKVRIAKQVPKFFSLIPKGDYKIVESGNPEDAAGRYHSPTELQPLGKFVVNTHNLKAVAAYDVATLSLHEAVPGHHFQLALQFEMKDQLSEYQRKVFGSNAFSEGWALYAEKLGREMGAYHTPLERLGNLNGEMWRAVRLVVDTGIHEMGWSREKTLEYMMANMAGDAKDIETEADRYSVWPGQALGYKIGELKIIELRERAKAALGKRFDIRDFHRVVIGSGSVSLPILERQVDEWIAGIKG